MLSLLLILFDNWKYISTVLLRIYRFCGFKKINTAPVLVNMKGIGGNEYSIYT